MTTLTNDDLQYADHVLGLNGFVFPYDIMLYQALDGQVVTEEFWNGYGWNPPQLYQEHTVADPNASPKPTWEELLAAVENGGVDVIRQKMLRRMRYVCEERIVVAYGEASWQDEVTLRMRGGQTAEQDAERDRLRTRYGILKRWIDAEGRTMAQLQNLDLYTDETWAETFTLPAG